jgi:XTP/dITP diphosphohydrolase
MVLTLLVATNNRHKLEEYQEILADLPFRLTHPSAEGLALEPAETGTTFEENAIIKATTFAQASGLPTLADDSGLEVDALRGEPGVFSARYGDTAKNDHVGRYRLLLEKLAARNLTWAERTARFRCVVAISQADRLIGTAQGSVEGIIAFEAKGRGGFGYDPVFFIQEMNRTMAELSPAQKHSISHRGRAARAAMPLLTRLARSK